MASPRSRLYSRIVVATAAALLTAGCGPSKPPSTPPTGEPTPEGTDVELRYAAAVPLDQSLQVELTHTSLGMYLDSRIDVKATQTLSATGNQLKAAWTVESIEALELEGTADAKEIERTRSLITDHGAGTTLIDARGLVDIAGTEAEPTNEKRLQAQDEAAKQSPAGALLATVLFDELALPRLPEQPLRMEQPFEFEEETETVVTDLEQTLPTTTLVRFTLRRIDETGLAEIAIERASVAELDEDPAEAALEAAGEDPAADEGDAEDGAPYVRMETKTDGTLLFDAARGLPVSLELNRTERFVIGEEEVERNIGVRSTYEVR
ncbi:MAG: hypothetical protein AAF799_30160 [Myxococcota bacterium]